MHRGGDDADLVPVGVEDDTAPPVAGEADRGGPGVPVEGALVDALRRLEDVDLDGEVRGTKRCP